ncbi:multimeric flavodoxin WrbA [Hydrogenispora ethanolica]|uniref:Multimeric flavodoxin WrbA n=1 Tax=Hydrogenispora ethanolica TaxID=1082276 RepID=A0A4R1R0J6_HYDET|nr:flavodoxin family protein [Hydrogenispora ethanolica]TCL58796.1 multimeric flavodoxin WrbA [Hydrogenispora ethanolica]
MKQTPKVVGVISSAHRNGNTAALVREALGGAAAAGATVEEIFLPQLRIEYCNGCFHCISAGECPIGDDFAAVQSALYEADGIILGSPTYAGSFNAVMQTLFERLGMYERLTSSLGGKYLAGVSSCSGMGAAAVARRMVRLMSGGIFGRGYESGTLGVPLRGREAAALPKPLRRARNLGGKLVRDIRRGRRFPLQNLAGRLVSRWILRPNFRRFILSNRDGGMKAVYQNLNRRGLLP